MTPPSACPFCEPAPGRVFWDADPAVLGLWDGFPVSPGHALVVTRRHVASWFDASRGEQVGLLAGIDVAREHIARNFGASDFNIGVNVGHDAGQTVPHLHVHLIPRYRGDVPDPRGGVRHVIPGKANYLANDVPTTFESADAAAIFGTESPADLDLDPTPDIAAFGQRLLQLLDEAQTSSTYKFAVLLALTDLCLEATDAAGRAPDVVTTSQLARKVVELYWPQVTAFAGTANRTAVLRQNSGSHQAKILSDILRFRSRAVGDASAPLSRARLAAPAAFERLLAQVERNLVKMPLPRLQRIGIGELRFLYEIGWDTGVRPGVVGTDEFDNRLCLKPGAGEALVRLSGLLRPLVQRRWAALVASFNRDATDEMRLQEFLFGADRIALDPVRAPLREFQSNRCFYCATRMSDAVDVDHFLPWARYPDNGVDNLVAAHPKCNSAKRDFLAAAEHVERWSERFLLSSDLDQIAQKSAWERAPERTRSVARALYLQLPADVRLWRHGREFAEVAAQRNAIRSALAAD